ncbi:hypothetical protein [Hyphomicrobium sp.]|uniref:hypothetical protein n=1 Tax=Hyphomicrobium sp. TaxID=82 RepID=UPI001D688DCC|nr:hypothetical protein [Hyphomicrobium sp.]MBY0561824.1 hypothetical protein [Hyphomicrobium sp.]
MRNLLLALALGLGIGFAATGAQAATLGGGNLAAVESAAKSGNSVVEQTRYRRHWRGGYGRGYYGPRYYRPYYGYGYNRPYRSYGHNRPWRQNHRRW